MIGSVGGNLCRDFLAVNERFEAENPVRHRFIRAQARRRYKPQPTVMAIKTRRDAPRLSLIGGANRLQRQGFSVAAIFRISSGACSPASAVPGMRYWPIASPPTSTGS